MHKSFLLKFALVFGVLLTFSGYPAGEYNIGVNDAYAQERDKKSESRGTHTSEKLKETGESLNAAEESLDEAMGWVAGKLKFFTDWVDSIVGIEGDNKGTNALFGLPIYVLVLFVGFFAIKMAYNIIRDTLKAIFSKSEGKPKGRHRR